MTLSTDNMDFQDFSVFFLPVDLLTSAQEKSKLIETYFSVLNKKMLFEAVRWVVSEKQGEMFWLPGHY